MVRWSYTLSKTSIAKREIKLKVQLLLSACPHTRGNIAEKVGNATYSYSRCQTKTPRYNTLYVKKVTCSTIFFDLYRFLTDSLNLTILCLNNIALTQYKRCFRLIFSESIAIFTVVSMNVSVSTENRTIIESSAIQLQ